MKTLVSGYNPNITNMNRQEIEALLKKKPECLEYKRYYIGLSYFTDDAGVVHVGTSTTTPDGRSTTGFGRTLEAAMAYVDEAPENNSPKNYKYANRYGWSDVYPFEIVKVISEQTIEVRPLEAKLDPNWKPEFVPGGFAGHCTNQSSQKWIYTSVPEAEVTRLRRHKDGLWYYKGSRFRLEKEPCKFYDYNF